MDILKSKIDLISDNLPKLIRFLPKTFDEFQKDDLREIHGFSPPQGFLLFLRYYKEG